MPKSVSVYVWTLKERKRCDQLVRPVESKAADGGKSILFLSLPKIAAIMLAEFPRLQAWVDILWPGKKQSVLEAKISKRRSMAKKGPLQLRHGPGNCRKATSVPKKAKPNTESKPIQAKFVFPEVTAPVQSVVSEVKGWVCPKCGLVLSPYRYCLCFGKAR